MNKITYQLCAEYWQYSKFMTSGLSKVDWYWVTGSLRSSSFTDSTFCTGKF